jgi:hypothetical protein
MQLMAVRHLYQGAASHATKCRFQQLARGGICALYVALSVRDENAIVHV